MWVCVLLFYCNFFHQQKTEDKKKADEGKKKADEAKKKADEAMKKADEAKVVSLYFLFVTPLPIQKKLGDKKKAEEEKKKAEAKAKVEGAKKGKEELKKANDAKKKAEDAKVSFGREIGHLWPCNSFYFCGTGQSEVFSERGRQDKESCRSGQGQG